MMKPQSFLLSLILPVLALGVALPVYAHETPDGNRMLIQQLNGERDVLIVDNIESMEFMTIPESAAQIEIVTTDDSSVTARISMTEGCKKWQALCLPADNEGLLQDITADFIQNNFTFESVTDRNIEFVDLDASTEYAIYTLAYDEFGLACDITSDTFSTLAAAPSEPAQVGDYLYRDGTWSSELKHTKTAIGIIFSTEVTDADRARGYTTGYAVAFKEIPSVEWTLEADENESGASFNGTDNADINDMAGLEHTLTLQENMAIHPAAKAVSEFGPVPPSSSGWFIPAAGQLIDIYCSLGNLNKEAMERSSSGIAEWPQEESATAIEIVNAKLAVAGEGNFDPMSVYTWTSTERSVMAAYYLYANPVLNISLQSYNKDSKFSVRPVIAF